MLQSVPARVTAALLLCGTFACRTPEQHRKDADDEVYALVDARRSEIFSEPGGFSIEPPATSMRQRILAGDWDPEHLHSLAEILEIAAENNRGYQSNKEGLYLAALDLTLERWQFGYRPDGSADASLTGLSDEAQVASAGGSVGFTKLLGSGATIVADLGADLFRVVSTGDGWDVVSDLGIAFTQPLLRGAGKRIVEEGLTQAERDLVYEVRAFERFRRTFAVDIASEVYDLLQAEDELANERTNYQTLLELSARNDAMAKAGRLTSIQADEAKQDELRSEATLLRLEASLGRQRDNFNLLLGLPIEATLRLDPREFDVLDEHDPLMELLQEEAAIEYALAARLDQQTTMDSVDDRRRAVLIAEDALGAGLSLGAQANTGSPEGRPFDVNGDDIAWSTSLSFDAPFDRKAERNAYRRSLISLAASERSAAEAADRITADVRDAMRQAENSRQDYIIQVGAVVLSERRVESTKLNLDAGRADTEAVLRSQEDLVAAQNAATSALINFTLARLELYLRLELLRVDETGIQVAGELAQGLLEGR